MSEIHSETSIDSNVEDEQLIDALHEIHHGQRATIANLSLEKFQADKAKHAEQRKSVMATNALTAMEDQIARTERQSSTLKTRLSRERNKMKHQRRSYQHEMSKMRQSLQFVPSERLSVPSINIDVDLASTDSMKSENKELKKRITLLTDKLNAKDDVHRTMRQNMRTALNSKESVRATYTERIEALKKKHRQEMDAIKRAYRTEIEMMKTEVKSNENWFDTLKQTLEKQVEREKESMQRKMGKMQMTYRDQIESLRRTNLLQSQQITRLKSMVKNEELLTLRTSYVKAEETIKELKEANEHLHEKVTETLDEVDRQSRATMQKEQNADIKVERMRIRLVEATDTIKEFEVENEELKDRVHETLLEMDRISKSTMQKELTKRAAMQTLRNRLVEAEKTINELKDENEGLRDYFSMFEQDETSLETNQAVKMEETEHAEVETTKSSKSPTETWTTTHDSTGSVVEVAESIHPLIEVNGEEKKQKDRSEGLISRESQNMIDTEMPMETLQDESESLLNIDETSRGTTQKEQSEQKKVQTLMGFEETLME